MYLSNVTITNYPEVSSEFRKELVRILVSDPDIGPFSVPIIGIGALRIYAYVRESKTLDRLLNNTTSFSIEVSRIDLDQLMGDSRNNMVIPPTLFKVEETDVNRFITRCRTTRVRSEVYRIPVPSPREDDTEQMEKNKYPLVDKVKAMGPYTRSFIDGTCYDAGGQMEQIERCAEYSSRLSLHLLKIMLEKNLITEQEAQELLEPLYGR